jgi:hypothetical protein
MVFRALSFGGTLDISAPELLSEQPTTIIFRRAVKSGDIFTIPDDWYDKIPNIKNAVTAGYLEILVPAASPSSGEDVARTWMGL